MRRTAGLVLSTTIVWCIQAASPALAALPSAIPVSAIAMGPSDPGYVSDDGQWLAQGGSTSTLINRFTGQIIELQGFMGDMTGDGRYVALQTSVNLDPADTVPNSSDVYRYDRLTSQYLRVTPVPALSSIPWMRINGDGTVIAYSVQESGANADRTRLWRVVVGGAPTAIPSSGGGFADFRRNNIDDISSDGRYISYSALCTSATTCTSGEVRRYDTNSGTTVRVSVNNVGTPANQVAETGQMSPSGRYVMFRTRATNLGVVPIGISSHWYVRDLTASTTTPLGSFVDHDAAITDSGLAVFAAETDSASGGVRTTVLVRDLATGGTSDIGTTPRFGPLDHDLDLRAISRNGLRAVFTSLSPDIVPGTQLGTMFVADIEGRLGARLPDDRLMDTRNGIGVPIAAPVAPGQEVAVQAIGRAGILAGTSALHVNVAIIQPAGPGFAKVYPCDDPPDSVSSINFAAMTVTTNAAMVKVSAAGTICVSASVTTHIAIDYQRPVAAFSVISPVRLLNTREPAGNPTPLVAGEDRALRVAGANGVEVASEGVAMNVTIVGPATNGFLRAFPCGSPTTLANMNFAAGQTKASLVVATPNAEGDVCFESSSAAHLVVDLVAHLPVESAYVPLTGTRLVSANEGPVRGGRVLRVFIPRVLFGNEIATLGIVAVQPALSGYVAAYNCATNIPLTSTLNFVPGRATSNLLFFQAGSLDDVCLYVSQDVTLVVDHYSSTLV
jgi:hypothetical protein